jgi:hypothetical protein
MPKVTVYLTSIQGKAVFAGDKVYSLSKKKFIEANRIQIDEMNNVNIQSFNDGIPEFTYVEDCVLFNDGSMLTNVHIDDFIDSIGWDRDNTMEDYAKFFFLLHRLPAYMKIAFDTWIKQYKLFCSYNGFRWRVTGCSRMGDIWLAKDPTQDTGYDERVMVDQVTDFSDNYNRPDRDLK